MAPFLFYSFYGDPIMGLRGGEMSEEERMTVHIGLLRRELADAYEERDGLRKSVLILQKQKEEEWKRAETAISIVISGLTSVN